MKKQKSFLTKAFALALTTPSLIFANSVQPISAHAGNAVKNATVWAAEDITTVNFIKGGTALTEAESLHLKAVYQKALRDSKNSLGRILVLTWPDRDDQKSKKASEAQFSLAQKRADVLREMLQDLSQKPVEVQNMAIAKSADTMTQVIEGKGGLGRALVVFERTPTPSTTPGNQAAGR